MICASSIKLFLLMFVHAHNATVSFDYDSICHYAFQIKSNSLFPQVTIFMTTRGAIININATMLNRVKLHHAIRLCFVDHACNVCERKV